LNSRHSLSDGITGSIGLCFPQISVRCSSACPTTQHIFMNPITITREAPFTKHDSLFMTGFP
jgi:hypothetical protein